MQINEIVGRVQPAKRFPNVDESANAKLAMLESRAKRSVAGASRAVTVTLPDVAVEPKRSRRRFGAGF